MTGIDSQQRARGGSASAAAWPSPASPTGWTEQDRTLRQAFEALIRQTLECEAADVSREARLAWRLSRFDQGVDLRTQAEALGLRLARARVLDAGGGYGGDALPFSLLGAQTWVVDAGDNHFDALNAFAQERGLPLVAGVDDVLALGFPDEHFDLVLSLDVIEHVPDPDGLARELARVLKPGGLALVTTPARWKFLRQDPHFGVPLLHVLPDQYRERVARSVFGATYPWPVYRIYGSLGEVGRPFWRHGLSVQTASPWSPAAARLRARLPEGVFKALEARFWELLVIRKPALSV